MRFLYVVCAEYVCIVMERKTKRNDIPKHNKQVTEDI